MVSIVLIADSIYHKASYIVLL